VPVFQRNKLTFLPLIKQYVHPGGSIFTDKWGAYRNLEKNLTEMKVNHRSVNHKIDFVNSHDPEVHTQTVEAYG
jgi:hypothetical protein